MCAITLPQRAIPCYINPPAKHLSHRERLSTFSLVHKCLDCGYAHDIMEALLELVDNIVSELGLQDSDE